MHYPQGSKAVSQSTASSPGQKPGKPAVCSKAGTMATKSSDQTPDKVMFFL
jgi:hypothetical protein